MVKKILLQVKIDDNVVKELAVTKTIKVFIGYGYTTCCWRGRIGEESVN